jgi:hypothetical protein
MSAFRPENLRSSMDNLNWEKENQKVGSIVGHADGYSFIIENVSPNRFIGYPWQKMEIIFESQIFPTIEEAQTALKEKLNDDTTV